MMERLNATARQHGWKAELAWAGFRSRDSENASLSGELTAEPHVRTTFKSLLRRFVSKSWIAERAGKIPN